MNTYKGICNGYRKIFVTFDHEAQPFEKFFLGPFWLLQPLILESKSLKLRHATDCGKSVLSFKVIVDGCKIHFWTNMAKLLRNILFNFQL